jgi:hypothetical protein
MLLPVIERTGVSDISHIEIHTAEPTVPCLVLFKWKLLLQICKGINRCVIIKFRQDWFKKEVKYYGMRSINSLILFGIWKNCLINGRSILLCQFTIRAIKLILVIIVGYQCYQHNTKLYPTSLSQG